MSSEIDLAEASQFLHTRLYEAFQQAEDIDITVTSIIMAIGRSQESNDLLESVYQRMVSDLMPKTGYVAEALLAGANYALKLSNLTASERMPKHDQAMPAQEDTARPRQQSLSRHDEICINLWYYVDSDTKLIYAISGRPYVIRGTDQDRLKMLQRLSLTDYVMADKMPVPPRFRVVRGNEEIEGLGWASLIDLEEAEFFEELFQHLETQLPKITKFRSDGPHVQAQRISQDPLTVITPLLEDKEGNITPIVGK